jgi:hypothetical protein
VLLEQAFIIDHENRSNETVPSLKVPLQSKRVGLNLADTPDVVELPRSAAALREVLHLDEQLVLLHQESLLGRLVLREVEQVRDDEIDSLALVDLSVEVREAPACDG